MSKRQSKRKRGLTDDISTSSRTLKKQNLSNYEKKKEEVKSEENSSLYDHMIGTWEEPKNRYTMLYMGAGWDMSFPMYSVNVLIDAIPMYPHYTNKQYGASLARSLKPAIESQLRSIFLDEDLEHKEDKVLNRWEWYSHKRDVRIIYYHSFKFITHPVLTMKNERRFRSRIRMTPQQMEKQQQQYDEQKLPVEAVDADVLYVSGYHPVGVDKFLPKLKCCYVNSGTASWKPEASVSNTLLTSKLPLSVNRMAYLKNVCEYVRTLGRMEMDLTRSVQNSFNILDIIHKYCNDIIDQSLPIKIQSKVFTRKLRSFTKP
jgi:hypothetical protein